MSKLIIRYCLNSLYEKLASEAPLPEAKCACVIKQILNVLAYLHSNRMVHGSVRPKNISVEINDCDDWHIKMKVFYNTFDTSGKSSYGNPLFAAPEVISGLSASENSDIWSAGIILFMMLTGKLPFLTKDQDALKREIMSCDPAPDAFAIYSKYVSDKCIEFICCMLRKDPRKRSTAKELLEHQWIKANAPDKEIKNTEFKDVFKNMSTFNPQYCLEQAVLTYITVNNNSNEDEGKLRNIFMRLDKSKDGLIQKNEFASIVNVMKDQFNYTVEELNAMFDQIDSDKSGSIDYTEFIKAASNKKKVTTESNLRAAFDYFDKDHNGSISRKEMKQIFANSSINSDKVIKELMQGIDSDNDNNVLILADKFRRI